MSHAPEIGNVGGRRIFALGGTLELDGRVSWVPEGATGHQAVNAYLILDDGEALLVDTGVAAHRRLVLDQLAELVPPGGPLAVFFTRPLEFSCNGNLGAIAEAYELRRIYVGGISSPLDSFDVARSPAFESIAVRHGDAVELGAGPPLEVISPPVRILVTHWLYEPATRTMLTSDLFGHTVTATADAPRIAPATDEVALDDVRAHLETKVWWLTHSPTRGPALAMRDIIDRYEIDALGPTFGSILSGRDQVQRHTGLLLEALGAPKEVTVD